MVPMSRRNVRHSLQGISLSGGQKQCVNICRAISADAAVTIFDDPLSALDARVGETVFNNVLVGDRGDKTRILVTHALYFLSQVDRIYCILDGRIVEQGTYDELIAAKGAFATHIKEFVSKQKEEEQEEKEAKRQDRKNKKEETERNKREEEEERKREKREKQEEKEREEREGKEREEKEKREEWLNSGIILRSKKELKPLPPKRRRRREED